MPETRDAPSQRMLSDAKNGLRPPHLPHLSQPQLTGLALWVCGAILAGSACQNAVASALSPWSNWYNLRQRLREWLYDGGDRATPCQTELDVTLCFAPLLRWVLCWWRSGGLALAIDPTLKGDQTTAIVISVVYRSCAIPVAWHIRHADQPGSWMDPTVELLQALAPAVPENMTVIVLCDRGIASPKLWQQIRDQGGIPVCATERTSLSALTGQTIARPALRLPSRYGRGLAAAPPSAPPMAPLHPAGGLVLRTGGTLDHPHRPCTRSGGSHWYALRFWIELGFKALKSLGWKWDKTRRTDPTRVSRHWLVLSVATLLALAYGTRVEDAQEQDCSRQPAGAGKDWLPITVTLGAVRRVGERDPPRHRLAPALAAQGPPRACVWLGTLA